MMRAPPSVSLIALTFVTSLAAFATKKPQTWLELRSPHFILITNGDEKQARHVAQQFELIRGIFKKVYPRARVDPGEPVIILAAKDESSLKVLLPAFWEKKGQAHPDGIFVHGQEKNYVALRLDAQGDNPYHVVYHEYVHLLTNLNLRWLPVWLSEGMAEFFASAEIDRKGVLIGRPTRSQLTLLREHQLIPLEALFSADQSSPLYNEENKASIFYAQSWAVTHYLLVGDKGVHENQFYEYVSLLQQEMDEPEARRRAFGDLEQLKKSIQQYLGFFSFYGIRLDAPEDVDPSQFTMREMTPAESAAVRGDFLLYTHRPVEAQALLEEALRLDPHLASAHESMGFLYYQKEDYDQAGEWFQKAVQLDSRSYLTQYYFAMLKEREFRGRDDLGPVEASLRRAIELNNQFAPAYATLASLYLRQQRRPEETLSLARRAAELEPGESGYQLNVVSALLLNRRVEEARQLAERIRSTARSAEERTGAEGLLASIRQYQEYEAARKRAKERERAEEEEFEKKLAAAQQAVRARGEREKQEESAAAAAAARAAPVLPAGSSKAGWSTGQVVAVSCHGPALELILQGTFSKLRLHSSDYLKVEIAKTDEKSPPPFDPCQHLQGRQAAISYRQYDGSPYDGEIVSIEVRK
jgi:tetratricopeptide (TPR) repeat protein